MTSPELQQPTVLRAARQWWSDLAAREGRMAAARQFAVAVWDFLRDSTPERRRLRFGDAEYDWDHRVNTTSAAVGWRDRLLGVFHSPYQPTEPALFREMLEALQQQVHLDFREFTFIDLGSGKGRTLLLASDYPFRRILGVVATRSCMCDCPASTTRPDLPSHWQYPTRYGDSVTTRLEALGQCIPPSQDGYRNREGTIFLPASRRIGARVSGRVSRCEPL